MLDMSSDDRAPCTSKAFQRRVSRPLVEEPERSEVQNEEPEQEQVEEKLVRTVKFPDEEHIVTQYFEPANPWRNVPATTRVELAGQYYESCRRHRTRPIESVLHQIREMPEKSIGGGMRAARLTIRACSLVGAAAADALEAVLKKAQFRRIEIEDVEIDDDGAEALFDMFEYYESANAVCLSNARQFGIRGWQAACRLIKRSSSLTEFEICKQPLEASHAPVLSRALNTAACRLRMLCLQQTRLTGEPLLCLVIALKSNYSVSELRLCDNDLTAGDAAILGSLLRFNLRIQLLDLSNNHIQDTGISHLAEALSEQAQYMRPQSPQTSPMSPTSPSSPLSPQHGGNTESRGLSVLVLWNNQLTRNCAMYLTKAVTSRSLTVLNIGRNALGTESVRALAGAGGALVCLGLQAARLGPDAAKALSDYIRTDSSLQRLDLRENRLGSEGLKMIKGAMHCNNTITQIDLDEPLSPESIPPDPAEQTIDQQEAIVMRALITEIRTLCSRNEPNASRLGNSARRKMSLTCHTAPNPAVTTSPESTQLLTASPGGSSTGARLRSPAPSPAGSPLPTQHNRFSVTRVTPERDSSADSSPSTPTRPGYATPSRFRVVQVAESPQIQVQASEPRKSPSRFSVTRNYDASYSMTPSPSPPPTRALTPQPGDVTHTAKTANQETHERSHIETIGDKISQVNRTNSDVLLDDRLKSKVREDASSISGVSQSDKSKIEVSQPGRTKVLPPDEKKQEDVKSERIKHEIAETEGTKPVVLKTDDENYKKEILSVISKTGKAEDVLKSVKGESVVARVAEKSISQESTDSGLDSMFYEPSGILKDKESEISEREMPEVFTERDATSVKTISDAKEHAEFKFDSFESTLLDRRDTFDSPVTIPVIIHANKTQTRVEAGFHEPGDDSAKTVRRQCDYSDKNDQIISSDVTDAKNLINVDGSGERTSDKLTVKAKIAPSVVDVKLDNVNKGNYVHKNIVSEKAELSDNPSYQDKSEQVSHSEVIDEDKMKTETKLVRNKTEMSETEKVDLKVEVTVKTESLKPAKVQNDQNIHDIARNNDLNSNINKDDIAMKKIEAITEDLGNLIQEMQDLSHKTTAVLTKKDVKVRNDCTQTDVDVNKVDNLGNVNDVPANVIRDNVVLKKNKSESSLDSPDLEVSRLMNKKITGSPFCDSSSSLEISGSSMESLNLENQQHMRTKPIIIQESVESDSELDRRKIDHIPLSTESSLESSELPVNNNLLNMSVSSNESVSPIIFGKGKKIHGSLSSLEASVSSLESARHERLMVTSADSGIEYSIQNPTENKDENSSNEGTLTNNSSLKESCKNSQDTLTSSPKRTSSLLDVPALKTKDRLDRMRKISWVAPSSSFQVSKPEPEKVEIKLPSHLEKLLSLFQHPTSLFSRTQSEDEKKSASNTPPRKDSSLTSSFWSWGVSGKEKDEDKDDRDSPEATDSTLSERVQVSFVDESFSRKLDSKSPSTDTENTLSEFQSFPQGNSDGSDQSQGNKVAQITTEDSIVQNVDLSSNVDNATTVACTMDLINPNDLNKNYENTSDRNKITEAELHKVDVKGDEIKEPVRPRTFAAVLKSSGSENSLGKPSPDSGQPVDKLPSKVIRGIKENISPENTLTSSMSNTKALALELSERKEKVQATKIWDAQEESRVDKEGKAPIATIEETNDEVADNTVQLAFIDDIKFIDDKNVSGDSGVTSLECTEESKSKSILTELEAVDVGKDALSYLIYENQDFDPDIEQTVANVTQEHSLAQELKDAEVKEQLIDLSPELVIDEAIELPDVFSSKEIKGLRTSPVIPERAKLKKSNSLEHIIEKDSPKSKTIAFKIPESTTPRDIPERRSKLRSRSGSSPKSLPECLNKQYPISKIDTSITKKKKKVSSLGKIARDSLLALNMSEEEIAEFRRSYKLTSVESLKSLESVSEDANSQSGTSVDSRCRSCLRTSQESLISLDSMPEECKCLVDSDKEKRSLR